MFGSARFLCKRCSLVVFAIGTAHLPLTVLADSCETAPGSGVYTSDCSKLQDYEIRQGAKKPATARPGSPAPSETLREKLRRALKVREAQSAQASKIADRITDAQNRAKDALRRGQEAVNPETRAKAKLDFARAMKDLSAAYNDADALIASDKKSDWNQIKQTSIADLEKRATQAFAVETASVAQAERPSPDASFEHCESVAPSQGVLTCYQAPRRGLSCKKVHKQGGDVIWSEHQQPCESTRFLEMRNEYFNRLEARRNYQVRQGEAVATLSPKCRTELNALLEGAQKRDGGKAHGAYAALRAECDGAIRKLAQEASARLPERRLSARASDALARAMNKEGPSFPRGASADNGGARPQETYDVDEVIGLGLNLLGLLGNVARTQNRAVGNVSAPTVTPAKPTYGQGAPSPRYRAPRASPSDITGTK